MAKRKHGGGSGDGSQSVLPQKRQKTGDDSARDLVKQLPKASIKLDAIPPYSYPPTITRSAIPPLPAIKDSDLASTPFKHVSRSKQNVGLIAGLHDSYERLEFIGDAYLELFASRMLFHRFAFLTPPNYFSRVVQMRTDIVNNETLAEFANHYDFLDKMEIAQKDKFIQEVGKHGRRLIKILGDAFEAFVAAVTLDDGLGIAAAEKWMAALWEDKVQALSRRHGLREARQPKRFPNDHGDTPAVNQGDVLDPGQHSGRPDDFHDKALEFLGGGYIEFIATSIVFTRFENMSPGRMSQITEKLIKNDMLAKLARESQIPALERLDKTPHRIPKDRTRAIADAYRAHIGSQALQEEARVHRLGKQLLRLWAPTLIEEIESDRVLNCGVASGAKSDPRTTYDTNARALLQQRLVGGGGQTKLEYEKYQDSIELKGGQLGQSRHFIACYLTGYEYERKFLGKGEGRSKAEASNWAAMEAMYGDSKELVDECAAKNAAEKERKKAERLAREAEHNEEA